MTSRAWHYQIFRDSKKFHYQNGGYKSVLYEIVNKARHEPFQMKMSFPHAALFFSVTKQVCIRQVLSGQVAPIKIKAGMSISNVRIFCFSNRTTILNLYFAEMLKIHLQIK